tara:strand:- start:727 stop:1071 length:345 start_codon:yes stop_codon:yes gene_type:complete
MSYCLSGLQYHYYSYKAGQFPASPENSKDAEEGALTVTFEYDNTNDVYVFPAFKINPYRLDASKPATQQELEENVLLKSFVNNAKLEYKDALEGVFKIADVKLKDIAVKDVYFL